MIENDYIKYWIEDGILYSEYKKETAIVLELCRKYGQDFLYACAVIVNSHLTLFIYNIFVKTKTVRVPLKAFTKKEKAAEWLKETKIKIEKNNQSK